MSARVIYRCDEKGCSAYVDTPLFDDGYNVPKHWKITLPGLKNSGVTLCPWHKEGSK